MTTAAALAHPNVALSKYWGKRPGQDNVPAVPSLSVTLAGLATRTTVSFEGSLNEDRILINGQTVDGVARARAVRLLDRVRNAAADDRRAEVTSYNDFPTASGLASSASGFAALAVAATRAVGLEWDAPRTSDLARLSSASAARSVYGGFVELEAGPADGPPTSFLSARPFAPPEQLPLVVLVCVTTLAQKPVSSTQGMLTTLERSPYAHAWLSEAPRLHARLRDALLAKDFVGVGELAEASALAMHASAVAAGVVYWNGATLDVLEAIRGLRSSGIPTYASIDAGPHVKVLTRSDDAPTARACLERVPGVARLIEARPGEGARLTPGSNAEGGTVPAAVASKATR